MRPCPDFYCADPNCTLHPDENWCGPCQGWVEGDPCDPAPEARVFTINDEFLDWLDVGIARSWISDVTCATHDGVPTDDHEAGEMEEGYDPCIPVVRIWEGNITL